MRVVIFFVCLTSLLLKGYTSICHPPSQHSTKTQRASIKFSDLDVEDDVYLMTEEVEEDEDDDEQENNNDEYTKKQYASARYNLPPSHTSILTYLYSSLKEPLPDSKYSPPKYILQRALRI